MSSPEDRPERTLLAALARRVDQAASMQASLRGAYSAVAVTLAVVVLVLSAVVLAFAFAGDEAPVTILGVTARRATWLGWLAVGIFSLTLVDLLTDPRGASRRRAESVKAYAALKDDIRSAIAETDPGRDAVARLSERYAQISALAPPVPNVLFNHLKARHLRKVAISRILSDRPGTTVRAARKAVRDGLRDPQPAHRPDSGVPDRAR
jgi:hypothetical protein